MVFLTVDWLDRMLWLDRDFGSFAYDFFVWFCLGLEPGSRFRYVMLRCFTGAGQAFACLRFGLMLCLISDLNLAYV